jgi:transposase
VGAQLAPSVPGRARSASRSEVAEGPRTEVQGKEARQTPAHHQTSSDSRGSESRVVIDETHEQRRLACGAGSRCAERTEKTPGRARAHRRLGVVPQHVVQEVRASLLDRVEPVGREALVAHARAKLTFEGRRLLVERVLELGWSVPTAAEAQGCSPATGYKWIRRFVAEGLQGLHDRTSRPHRSPARLSARREAAIQARREATLEGPHRIAWALGEAPSTVHRVLRRLGAPRLRDLDRPTRSVVRYERDRPGELVHVDVKKQGRIPDGGGWRVHGRGVRRGRPGETRPRLRIRPRRRR